MYLTQQKQHLTDISESRCSLYSSVGNVYMVVNECDTTFFTKSIGY